MMEVFSMPKKFDRCVKKLKKKKNSVKNPYAVCMAAMKRKKKR